MRSSDDLLRSMSRAEWRNGRRWGLKIPCPTGRVGSTPTSAIELNEFEYRIDTAGGKNSRPLISNGGIYG